MALDLNCLKECNDTLGHAAGDEYLLGTAKSIRQVFERYGKCYRIGGDEFVVLLKKPARADVGDLVLKVTNRVQISVRDLPIKELGVAAGYEFYDPKKDQNLEDTRIRADQKLYNNKKSMKEKLSVG